jgi:hypothetical protein
MALFLNETGTIGTVIIGLDGITGSLFLTLLAIMIILVILALALRIPLEVTSIIFLPFLITVTAYTREFLAVFGIFLIYGAILIAKNLLKNNP